MNLMKNYKISFVFLNSCLAGKDIEDFKKAFKADIIIGFNINIYKDNGEEMANVVFQNLKIYLEKNNLKLNEIDVGVFEQIIKNPPKDEGYEIYPGNVTSHESVVVK